MSGKPKVEMKRVPSVKVAPKPVAKAPVKAKKVRAPKPHKKYWTGRKNWKLNPEWVKDQEREKKMKAKKEEKKEEEKKEDKK